MMARSYGEAELHRSVGELDARVEMLQEDMQTLITELKQSSLENQRILQKLDKVENKLDPLPDAVAKHDSRIGRLEQFDGKLMGVVTLGGLTISAIGTGFWMLITNFSAVVSFAKKLFGWMP
jgi:predicted RNase H-like nuclease (RuvC/YqgF family)